MEKPNFYILGAAKSGTTTLYDLLRQHPNIFLPVDKEPMFFSRDDYYDRGMDWYLKTFFSRSDSFQVRGEASPHYLYWADKVAPRIFNAHENSPVKFIIILRNPIERAYSWYWNMIADKRESLPFFDAIKKEEEQLKENWERLEYFGSMEFGYLRGGSYMAQIQSFLKYFDKQQFLFLLQDDLKQNNNEVYHHTCQFLGVDSDADVKLQRSNISSLPRNQRIHQFIRKPSKFKDLFKPFISNTFRYRIKKMLLKLNNKTFQYPEMSGEAHQFLLHYYRTEIDSLSNFLDRDLSCWKT